MFESKTLMTAAVVLVALGGFATPAAAQTDPKFAFVKADEVKPVPEVPLVEWKVQAKAGMNVTTGNSQTTNGSAGLSASRKEGNNKLSLDGNIAYGRSNVLVPVFGDATMPTVITALDRNQVTSTNNWLAKGRYDRFFTPNNSGYAMGLAASDKIAGKKFAGGGQVGYSRQLVKDEKNLLVAEIGYDFSYESYIQQPMKTIDPVTIHSARVFVGETLKLTPATGINASVEALFNLNNETKAVNVRDGTPGVAPFKDTRVIGKVGLSTTLLKSLSAAVGFTLRYDQNPAPRPIPSGSPAGSSYAQTGVFPAGGPFADKTDTLTEVTLIYTFL